MQCPECNSMNDADALFCSTCGKTLQDAAATPARSRKPYWYMLVLAPVLVLVVGIGYYKFLLPDGIAAVVNGEEIKLSELDGVVARSQRTGAAADPRFRYRALNMLIMERLVQQEARKAGMDISREELASALVQARSASGVQDDAFDREIAAQYGSMQAYEDALKRRLLTSRFLAEKAVPRNANPETVRMTRERWMQDLMARASIRVTLSEEMQGPGCGNGCGKGNGPGKPCQGAQGHDCARANGNGCDHMNKPQ